MLNSWSSNVVVDFGSTKQAAIFFDHVVPVDGVEGVSGVGHVLSRTHSPVDIAQAQTIISQLLPADFGSAQEIADFASVAAIGVSAIGAAVGFYNCEPMNQQAREYSAKLDAPPGVERYIGNVPVTVDSRFIDSQQKEVLDEQHPVLSIADIRIPDTKEMSWDAIIELRKDAEARKRLRRMRVFATTEYVGKSRAFIEDDLCVRMDNDEQTLKSWGIKTVMGALSTCMTLETTLPTGIASVVSIMSGLPAPEVIATSLALPCGRFVLELAKTRLSRNDAIREYPLAYLTDVRRIAN